MINVIFCFGLVLTFFISSFVTWRILAWILLAPMGMTALGMLIVPETPLWLAQKGRLKDSLEALAWLRCNEETKEEVKELKDRFDTETKSSENVPISAFFLLKALYKNLFGIFAI